MLRTPYLIQRATINAPLAEEDTRLSQAVNFDYMGSAEFEFGALPESFRRIEEQFYHWKCRLVPEIKEGESPLRVYSALTDAEFEEYKAFLIRLRQPNNRVHLKEAAHFEEGFTERYKFRRNTDFWWDIENDVMFGFHKEFMNRLPRHVAASLKYMNDQKARQ